MRIQLLILLSLLTHSSFAQTPYLDLSEKEVRDYLAKDKEVTEFEIHFTSNGRKSLRFFKGTDIVNTLVFGKNERIELQVVHPVEDQQIEKIKTAYNKFNLLEKINNNSWVFVQNPTYKKYVIYGKKIKAHFKMLDVFSDGYYFIICDKQFYRDNEKDILDRIKNDNLY